MQRRESTDLNEIARRIDLRRSFLASDLLPGSVEILPGLVLQGEDCGWSRCLGLKAWVVSAFKSRTGASMTEQHEREQGDETL